jgi:hypothetical protein
MQGVGRGRNSGMTLADDNPGLLVMREDAPSSLFASTSLKWNRVGREYNRRH